MLTKAPPAVARPVDRRDRVLVQIHEDLHAFAHPVVANIAEELSHPTRIRFEADDDDADDTLRQQGQEPKEVTIVLAPIEATDPHEGKIRRPEVCPHRRTGGLEHLVIDFVGHHLEKAAEGHGELLPDDVSKVCAGHPNPRDRLQLQPFQLLLDHLDS